MDFTINCRDSCRYSELFIVPTHINERSWVLASILSAGNMFTFMFFSLITVFTTRPQTRHTSIQHVIKPMLCYADISVFVLPLITLLITKKTFCKTMLCILIGTYFFCQGYMAASIPK